MATGDISYVATDSKTEDGHVIYHRRIEGQKGRPAQFVKKGGEYVPLNG